MEEQTQIQPESSQSEKLFSLTPFQVQKIEKITDDFISEWNSELQADVWPQFADKYNIVFVRFSDNRYSVRTKDGMEHAPAEITGRLDSLLQILNKRNHEHGFVPRIPKSDNSKSESLTFLTAMPAAKDLENWLKGSKKKDLKGFMNLYNRKSQELKPKQEGMTLDQYQVYLTELACEFAILHEGMVELSRKENKKIGALNAEKHKLAQTGLLRKSRGTSSKSNSAPKIKKADLTPIQRLMQTFGMDISDPVEVKKFELKYQSEMPKSVITKTSSTETSYGEKSQN